MIEQLKRKLDEFKKLESYDYHTPRSLRWVRKHIRRLRRDIKKLEAANDNE